MPSRSMLQLFVCVAPLACQSPWAMYTPNSDGFMVRMPPAVQRQEKPWEGTQMVTHTSTDKGVTVRVMHGVAPATLGTDSHQVLEHAEAALAPSGSATVLTRKTGAHDGMMAVDAVLQVPQAVVARRIISRWPRLWVLESEAADRSAALGAQDRLLASFHVLDPGSQDGLPAQPGASDPVVPAALPAETCTGNTVQRATANGVGTGQVCVDAQGLETGPYKAVYADGQRLEEGLQRDGKRVGLWKTWRADGTAASEVEYKDGLKNGRETLFDIKGEREEEGSNKADRKHGVWRLYASNGVPIRESTWVNGKKEGRETQWNPEGMRVKEGPFVGGIQQGRWVAYHPNGRKAAEGEMERGEPAGVWTRWTEEGQRTNSLEYRNGNAEVLEDIPQCPAGTIRVEHPAWRDGKEEWCEDTPRPGRSYSSRHGPYTRYDSEGNVREEGRYENGRKVGTWRTRDANGRVESELTYNQGRLVTQRRMRNRRR